MAFPWPGKKDALDPLPKREYPAGLDVGIDSSETPRKTEAPRESSVKSSRQAAPKPQPADDMQELAEQLGRLGQVLDQTKDQVVEALLQRQVQIADVLSDKLDALAEELGRASEGAGSRSLDQKLDALYGKLDMLASAARSAPAGGGGEGAAPALSEAAIKSALRPLLDKFEQVDGMLKTIGERAAAAEAVKEAFVPTLTKVRDGLSEQHAALHGGIAQIQQNVTVLPQYFEALRQQIVATQQRSDAGLRQIVEILRPTKPESTGPEVGGDWAEAVLGDDLACNQAIHAERQQLLGGVLKGDPAARSLTGQLLVFRSSAAEKMPTLLKEIGEAYYRWHPRLTAKPTDFEKALIEFLQRTCDQAGMSNTIELVHPGERFDSARHNASERGVEITQVLGWIVLRDNGKVYTKATVAVK